MLTPDGNFNLTINGDRYSTNKVLLSLPCMAKLVLIGHLPHLTAVLVGIGAVLATRFWFRRKARISLEVQNLASMVLLELQLKRESSPSDTGIVVDHLRDKLLQGLKDKDKAAIWRRVQAVVQADSRVGEYASWRNGVQVTSWEWQSA